MNIQFGNARPCSPFQLSAELVRALEPLATTATAARGDVVVQQGSPCRGLYVIKTGSVAAFSLAENGKEIFRRVLGPGCVVGLPATLCSQPYSFGAQCLGDSTLHFIEIPAFLDFMKAQPLLCMEVVRLMGQELTELNQRRTNLQACRDCGCSFADICSHELGGC